MCHTQFQGFRKLQVPEARANFANFKQNEADKSMNGSVSDMSGAAPRRNFRCRRGFFKTWLPWDECHGLLPQSQNSSLTSENPD